MNTLARRFALRVAAKVAVCASIGGCGQELAGPAPSPDASPSPVVPGDAAAHGADAMAWTATTGANASVDADSCRVPSNEGDTGISEQTFTCCAGRLATIVGDAGSVSSLSLAQAAATDPEVMACCEVIIRRITQDNQDSSPDVTKDRVLVAGELFPCCEVTPGSATQVGCESWGPPVPPSMPLWHAAHAQHAEVA